MYCYCNSLGAYYYTIGTDYSRIYVPDALSLLDMLLNLLSKFDTSIIAILFFLIFMLVIMPFIAIWRDRKDYDAIKDNNFEITEEMLRKISIRKKQPYDAIIYSKMRFDRYLQIESLSFF